MTRQLGLTDRPGYVPPVPRLWQPDAERSAQLTRLEERLFDLHQRIGKGAEAWAEDESAGIVADYTADEWAHKALMERLIEEQREVFMKVLEVEPWR